MKSFTSIVTLVSALVALALAGCSTTGNERSTETRKSMHNVESDISALSAQLDATDNSLSRLMTPNITNIQTSFDAYTANVEKMREAGQRFLEQIDAMSARGADYFAEWSKEGQTYSNQQIRAASEERRAELTSAFLRISQASTGVRGALQAYLSDIRDLQTFLSNDLTPKGLQAVQEMAEKTVNDGRELKRLIGPIQVAVADARGRLMPGSLATQE